MEGCVGGDAAPAKRTRQGSFSTFSIHGLRVRPLPVAEATPDRFSNAVPAFALLEDQAVGVHAVACPKRAVSVEDPRWPTALPGHAAHAIDEPALPTALDVRGADVVETRHNDSRLNTFRRLGDIRSEMLVVRGDLEDREQPARRCLHLKHPGRGV